LTRRDLALALLSLAVVEPGLAQEKADQTLPPRLEFLATRNGDEIGRCSFEFFEDWGRVEVRIDVQLVVRILSIPVYRWTHRAIEQWAANGLLVSMVADTDDDGALRHVEVHGDDKRGLILTVDGESTLLDDSDAIPASFWNPGIVYARTVIDAVTGKVGRPTVETIADPAPASNGGEAVRRYRIASDAGLKQEIAFSTAGRVVGFTAFAPDGSAIVYRVVPDR